MVTQAGPNGIPAAMELSRDSAGALSGTWSSQGQLMDLSNLSLDGSALSFDRAIPSGQVLHFAGTLEGETLSGAWTGAFGELPCGGTRDASDDALASESFEWAPHERPLVMQDGRTLLWANGTLDEDGAPTRGPDGESEDTVWFDMTDALIDPAAFSHGIGKDTIPSIEKPVFVAHDDPLLAERGVDLETEVLGVFLNGIARAYPRTIMSMHEVVNDEFGGKPYAVLW